jgi:transposase
MTIYLGLDVHARSTVYCAEKESGEILVRGEVLTSRSGFEEISARLGVGSGCRVGLETGSQSFWVSGLLSELGMESYVIDAQEVRQKSRRPRQKSDRRDAFELCDGLRRGIFVKHIYVPVAEVQRLRLIVSRRRHFVRLGTSQVNAAKSLLRSVGLSDLAGTLTTYKAWEELLAKPELATLRQFACAHYRVWRSSREQVDKLHDELVRALVPFKETVRRLQTVPGVGEITAATYIAVIARPDRFPSSSEVSSYLGLVPSGWDSGEREQHGPITKTGNSELRAMLVEAAHHASAPNHPLHPYFARVCAKSGFKKAVVCVAQRLARILWRMWLNEEDFAIEKLNVVRERRKVSRTYFWRIRDSVNPGVRA